MLRFNNFHHVSHTRLRAILSRKSRPYGVLSSLTSIHDLKLLKHYQHKIIKSIYKYQSNCILIDEVDLTDVQETFDDPFSKKSCLLGIHEMITDIINDKNYEIPLSKAENKNQLSLEECQIEIESTLYFQGIIEEALLTSQLRELGLETERKNVKQIEAMFYHSLVTELIKEVQMVREGNRGIDRNQYGPFLLLGIPPEKLAIITMDIALREILRTKKRKAYLTNVAKSIGDVFEIELNLLLSKSEDLRSWQKIAIKESSKLKKTELKLNRRLRQILNAEEMTIDMKVKLGTGLVAAMVRSIKLENGEAVFIHEKTAEPTRKLGRIGLSPAGMKLFADAEVLLPLPRFLPMIAPPKKWSNKSFYGSYYLLRAPLMKTNSKAQKQALREANITKVIDALNYIASVPWRIHPELYVVITQAWEKGENISDLPLKNNLPKVDKSSCYRPRKDLQTKLLDNKKHNFVQSDGATDTTTENTENGSVPLYFDEQYYKEMNRRVDKKNNEMHSLRCDLQLKLEVAKKFLPETIYFPCNLDFRGRAYPIPPNLNHIGSDLCRSLTIFHDSKPLGDHGFFWLKIHLSNLFGNNKITRAERIDWVDQHMEEVFDSAKDPMKGRRWWVTAESPFQALSTCKEIVAAMESGCVHSFKSQLPVHQDGSCNGLQHYAALGRDVSGAYSVNVAPSERPQDVYSTVLVKVLDQLLIDSQIDLNTTDPKLKQRKVCADLLSGIVSRKVIKQTVMTSVYGVTMIGARAQIKARLEEIYRADAATIVNPQIDMDLLMASNYLAKVTLDSLRLVFTSARLIMDWLGDCAGLVAKKNQTMAWLSPLGLPVMQPYRKESIHVVKTAMQKITLIDNDDDMPVAIKKQRTAFPPNFIHSLDATHMLLTSLRMKDAKLSFAAVHDSYWTHACDIDKMNKVLRESFVELYEQNLLEDLHTSLSIRFPDVEFPSIPERGGLDIRCVLESDYFFH